MHFLTDEQAERLQEIFKKVPKRLQETVINVQNGIRVIPKTRQRPTFFHYPELFALEWHDTSKYEWTKKLEENYEIIKNEFLNIQNEKHLFDEIKSSVIGEWRAFNLYNQGNKVEETCKKCPETTKLIESIPSLMKGVGIMYAYFSVIQPKTHITTHCGMCNLRLRCQLPIIVPKKENVSLRVGSETRKYKEGKCFIFDDTYDHEVIHDGNEEDGPRVVLLLDIWHPDLTELEKEAVKMLLPSPKLEELNSIG